MNLPREFGFRKENVLLVGIIPGPKETKHDINAFLAPLVKELLNFWSGVEISIQSLQKCVQVRCALLCVACDIPASRKVCGFLGHSADIGCSKCLKRFPGGGGGGAETPFLDFTPPGGLKEISTPQGRFCEH